MPGRTNLILDDKGNVLKGFYALSRTLGLSVNGHKGTFGLCTVSSLKKAYGGAHLGYALPEAARSRSRRA